MASPVVLRAQAASLRRDYPDWHIIISSAGRIWAQRRLDDFVTWLAGFGIRAFEVYDMVDGDSALEVREKIAAKEGR